MDSLPIHPSIHPVESTVQLVSCLATIGRYSGGNLTYLVLDNGRLSWLNHKTARANKHLLLQRRQLFAPNLEFDNRDYTFTLSASSELYLAVAIYPKAVGNQAVRNRSKVLTRLAKIRRSRPLFIPQHLPRSPRRGNLARVLEPQAGTGVAVAGGAGNVKTDVAAIGGPETSSVSQTGSVRGRGRASAYSLM